MSEYKDILGNIISSDDESIKQVYATADKELDISADSRKQFYDFAEKVHARSEKLNVFVILNWIVNPLKHFDKFINIVQIRRTFVLFKNNIYESGILSL